MKPPRIDGVPLHPVLVHFPVAGWTAASFLAVLAIPMDSAVLLAAAFWCNIVGLVTGMAAVGAGFLELSGLPEVDEIRSAAATHMMLAGSTWTVYLVMLFLQMKDFSLAAAVTGGVAFLLLMATGHAGARLVYHHRLPVP